MNHEPPHELDDRLDPQWPGGLDAEGLLLIFFQSTHRAIQANTDKLNQQAIDIAEIKASRWTAKDASEDRRQIASMMSDLRHVSRQLADIKLALVEQRHMLDVVRLRSKSTQPD